MPAYDLILAGGCQGSHIRETANEPVVIIQSLIDPGLLKYDLGHPYPVWVMGFPPGKIAPVKVIPGDEQPAKIHRFETNYQ